MSKPSAGALRAAKRFHEQGGSLYRTDEELATVIDEETGLPELLWALKVVLACAETAIAKAEGREGT